MVGVDFLACGLLLWASRALAQRTTLTQVQCQTYYSTESPYAIATHTTTVTTTAPDVTINFTSRPTVTLTPSSRQTVTRTSTLGTIVTHFSIKVLDGPTFSTTSTVYNIKTVTVNDTTTLFHQEIEVEPYAIAVHVITLSGFSFLLPTDAPALVAAPITDLDATETTLISPAETRYALPDGELLSVPPRGGIVLGKRSEYPSALSLKGLRGAFIRSSYQAPVNFPATVSCTKSYIIENVAWRPVVATPHTTFLPAATTTVTVVSTLTSTSVVPDHPAETTASRVITYMSTTTATLPNKVIATKEHMYTVSTTSTAYMACGTENVLGPKDADGAHIVNIYSHGQNEYSMFDHGFSDTAEDCCVECHTMNQPCMGSVFTDGQCLLLRRSDNVCRPSSTAGIYVTRPMDEQWQEGNRAWGNYTLSNGPCGRFQDGGTGW